MNQSLLDLQKMATEHNDPHVSSKLRAHEQRLRLCRAPALSPLQEMNLLLFYSVLYLVLDFIVILKDAFHYFTQMCVCVVIKRERECTLNISL